MAAAMTRAEALQWLARLGYGTRGIVYLVLGWLATTAALSDTRPPSLRGALATILEHRFGWLALAALAGGLFGYAAWRTAQAVLDLGAVGTGARGLAARGRQDQPETGAKQTLGRRFVRNCISRLPGVVRGAGFPGSSFAAVQDLIRIILFTSPPAKRRSG